MPYPRPKAVDHCTLQILVDNCIEWFYKMPPGFTHEMHQHMAAGPPIDKRTGAPYVDLDNFCCGAHGLSILITTQRDGETQSTLFDSGPEAISLARNVASLNIDMAKVDRIVLSHWHRDHSGGIAEAVKIATKQGRIKPVVVDLHPDRPIARGIAPQGNIFGRLPEDPSFEELESLGASVELHREMHTIAAGTVWISGAIPRVTAYEGGLVGAVTWFEEGGVGEWVPDQEIWDERYAAIDVKGKGLIVISSCSHAGIVNVLKHAVRTLQRPIYMVVGGFHLGGADLAPRIAPTVDFFSKQLKPTPTYVLPLHCTGFNAKVALREAMGEICVPAGVGHKIDVEGDVSAEEDLSEASYVSDAD